MDGFGGMLSIVLKGGVDAAKRSCERAELFTLAESLGGVESLLNHPAIMTHARIPPARRAQLGIEDALVRLSVGVEALADMRTDLDGALAWVRVLWTTCLRYARAGKASPAVSGSCCCGASVMLPS